MKRSEVSVLVVGAGVSGLSTASHLIQAGFSKLIVLEASNRIGGRILTVRPKEGEGVVELGGTVIHGASPENPVYKLCTEWGLADSLLKIERVSGQVYREDGKPINRDLVDQVWERYTKAENDMGNIFLSNKSCPNTITFAEFMEKEIPKILKEFPEEQQDDVSKTLNLMINYCRFINGDDLTRLSASLCGNYVTLPGEEMVFSGDGYRQFAEHLKMKIPAESFCFNAEVTNLCWDGESLVKVTCKNGDVYVADHVVVTCSLGFLKHNHKQLFEPALPSFKAEAIERTGFGRVNKLFLYYDKPFFKEGFELAWNELGSPDAEASDTAWLKDASLFEVLPTNPKAIGGPFAGRGAEIMESLTDEEVATVCTDVLKKFTRDPTIPMPTKVLRSSWISNPLFRGSYTYLSMQNRSHDIADIAAPLPDTGHPKLLFAGEATHSQYYSTVHGAYLSGVRESNRLTEIYTD